MTGPTREDESRCDQIRLDLGAYVLGALDPSERMAVDNHLAHCADCRSELSELAELPALLGRLTEAEAAEGLTVDPSPALLDGLLDQASSERRRSRRRTLLSVAAVAIAAVLGAGIVTSTLSGGHDSTTAVTTAVTAQGVAATADLRPAAHGTAIDLQIRGVRAGEWCRLLVVDPSGRQQVVSEWQVGYEGTAHVQATSASPPKEVTSLRVVTVDGTGLADLSVPLGA